MAAAAILVCRLSQSVFDQLTLMPVALVKASRSTFGGGVVARATVMVTPLVFWDAEDLPLEEQPVATSATLTSPATAAAETGRR